MHDARVFLAALLALLGCTSSTLSPVDCGENGEAFEDESGRYCAYLSASDDLECPPELSHAVPVGEGVVCAEEPKSLGELPPETCDGFDSITCGTACGLATINEDASCAAYIPPLGPPVGPWEIPILDVDGAVIEDGSNVSARTDSGGRLVLPLTLDVESHVATIGWRCYRVEARVTYPDGRVVETLGPWAELWEEGGFDPSDATVLGQYLSDDESFRVDVEVEGLGPVTLEVLTSWHDGQVYVWRREIVVGC
jgi:hypothetical protein